MNQIFRWSPTLRVKESGDKYGVFQCKCPETTNGAKRHTGKTPMVEWDFWAVDCGKIMGLRIGLDQRKEGVKVKIEIEVSDDMIRKELEETVIKQVRAVLSGWTVGDDVNRMVKDRWPKVIGAVIDEQVANHEAIRKRIADEIARKLKMQVSAAMKVAQS